MAVVKDESRNRWYISFKEKVGLEYKTRNIKVDASGEPWTIHGEGRVSRAYMNSIMAGEIERYKESKGSLVPRAEAVSLKSLVDAFVASETIARTSPSTIEQYQYCFKNYLFKFVPESTPTNKAFKLEVLDLIKAEIAKRNNTAHSINNKYIALKKLIAFARERKKISPEMKEDAFISLKRLKEADKSLARVNYLSNPKDDVKRLFDSFLSQDEEWLIPIEALFYSGCRIGEFLGIKVKDLNFESNVIIIGRQIDQHGKVKETKTRNVAPVHIPSDFMAELKFYVYERKLNDEDFLFQNKFGKPLSRHATRDMVNAHLEMAGLRHITLHGLRHTYASYLFEQGLDMKVVQSQLRHSSMSTTMDYYIHLTETQKNTAFDNLSLKAGGNGCNKMDENGKQWTNARRDRARKAS